MSQLSGMPLPLQSRARPARMSQESRKPLLLQSVSVPAAISQLSGMLLPLQSRTVPLSISVMSEMPLPLQSGMTMVTGTARALFVSFHSGSFWWPRPDAPEDENEWVARQYAIGERRPVRFYLEIGLQEGTSMVPTSRHLRDVLQAKGNEVHYREYNGGHDANCWRGGIAESLQLLTASWESPDAR